MASPQTHITSSSSEGAEILMLGLQQHWSFKSCDLKVYIWCHRHGPRLKVTSSTAICPLRPILRSALSSTCTHTHASIIISFTNSAQQQIWVMYACLTLSRECVVKVTCVCLQPCPPVLLQRAGPYLQQQKVLMRRLQQELTVVAL